MALPHISVNISKASEPTGNFHLVSFFSPCHDNDSSTIVLRILKLEHILSTSINWLVKEKSRSLAKWDKSVYTLKVSKL